MLSLGSGSDLSCRVACGQDSLGGKPLAGELRHELVEVFAVLAHFLRLPQIELSILPGDPPVRNMDEHERRITQARQPRTWSMIDASAGEWSSATRIRLYIGNGGVGGLTVKLDAGR